MKLAVITTEDIFVGEATALNGLFRAGMPLLHLRKPHSTEAQAAYLIEEINAEYRNRIVLHDHFGLCSRFSLKGVHVNGRNPEIPVGHTGSVSRSCHSINELREYCAEYDYLFLSPVFDSISKSGYSAAYSPEILGLAAAEGTINEKVYALGGVSPEMIPVAAEYGFGGVAVLGALWGDYADTKDYIALESHLVQLLILTEKQ